MNVAVAEHHDHHPDLRHQFDDLDQQHEAYFMGMWTFIITEIMFFGGLFIAYFVYRYQYYDGFVAGSLNLDLVLSSVNTIVLLCSSLTMALAVRGAQLGSKSQLIGLMLATLVLGSTFLGIKVVEYGQKFDHHLVPGPSFNFEEYGREHAEHAAGHGAHEIVKEADARHAELFFGLYFIMTGFHAFHMILGSIVIIILIILAWQDWFSPTYYAPIEMFGLYWHFVDIAWVFLFPFLYLINRH